MNARDPLLLGALSIALAACPVATPATAALACQARVTSTFSSPGEPVDFEALYAYGSGEIGFLWDFGDGSSSTQQNPSHTYTSSNIYRVTLTVTDAGAPQQTCRDTVDVPIGVVVDEYCSASASTLWGDAPLGVQFDGRCRFISDPPPYRCTWTFGDGDTSALCAPYHSYSAGTYWAVFTFHTGTRDYVARTLRITALDVTTPIRLTGWGRLKQLYR